MTPRCTGGCRFQRELVEHLFSDMSDACYLSLSTSNFPLASRTTVIRTLSAQFDVTGPTSEVRDMARN